ncbi:helix-turn-helix domain-containing protein [Bartonella henselae]|uniref:helix-turn-helix domain-containing protein n=1 Tax=Bartonella henselae TaxID=38323 RepID=UPI00095B7E93|nr:helix-turn-helix domain-containing protein [Bartonella henselae]OLL42150.1 hypothetical protein AT244_03315 [Bartonella henselae]OLL42857.1 hypothetical protein AT245_02940 [Bartonella henselae]
MTITQKEDRHSVLAKLCHRNITLTKRIETYQIVSSTVKNIWTHPNEKTKHALANLSGLHAKPIFVDCYFESCNRISKLAKHLLPFFSPYCAITSLESRF